MIYLEDKYHTFTNSLSGSTTTKKTTTAMVTMDYPLNEDDEQTEVEDVSESSVKSSLPVESIDTSSTTVRTEVNSQEEQQGI